MATEVTFVIVNVVHRHNYVTLCDGTTTSPPPESFTCKTADASTILHPQKMEYDDGEWCFFGVSIVREPQM